MYADAILDVLDPDHTIFYKRIYRNQCLKATIPSPSNHPLQDLLPSQDGVSRNQSDEVCLPKKPSPSIQLEQKAMLDS